MTGTDSAADSLGPTDEDRRNFGQTFLGSLLGRATLLVGAIGAYLSGLIVLWNQKTDLESMWAASGDWGFAAILALPFAAILVSGLPTVVQAMRQRRLRVASFAQIPDAAPDYFRLYPYGARDAESFRRLDGADKTILNWLQGSKDPILYLSGASGAGKSSILAASVLPKLRSDGWQVVEARVVDAPMENVREALIESGIFKRKPAPDANLADLLRRAGGSRTRNGDEPLLLVIDQFEEFLILNEAEKREPFVALIREIAAGDIQGVRLLLVFRSDYRPLVFKSDLPALDAGRNWQEIAPYARHDTAAFLQGGVQLAPESLEKMLAGLDRIEEARGLYRPITLNMVGLVLRRMGTKLAADPGQLIQSYLKHCLETPDVRDFARPILTRMITNAGTKDPCTENEIVRSTGLQAWQVKSTLAEFAKQGLVRRLGDRWEISHDFLARLLGQIVGRLRPSVWAQTRPLIAPSAVVLWLVLAALAWPAWLTVMNSDAQANLRNIGATVEDSEEKGGLLIKIDGEKLVQARDDLRWVKGPITLAIGYYRELKDYTPLAGLSNIASLELEGISNTGFIGLGDIPNLTRLTIINERDGGEDFFDKFSTIVEARRLESVEIKTAFYALENTDLTSLSKLQNLRTLILRGERGLNEPEEGKLDFSALEGVETLSTLQLFFRVDSQPRWSVKFPNFSLIESLRTLYVYSTMPVIEVSKIGGPNITDLAVDVLSYDDYFFEPERFPAMPKLRKFSVFIRFFGDEFALDFANFSENTSIEELEIGFDTLSGPGPTVDLKPLRSLSNLKSLDLSRMNIDLEPLRGSNLKSLVLYEVEVDDFSPVADDIETLSLEGWLGEWPTLAPFKGRPTNIEGDGLSEQLLGTRQ